VFPAHPIASTVPATRRHGPDRCCQS